MPSILRSHLFSVLLTFGLNGFDACDTTGPEHGNVFRLKTSAISKIRLVYIFDADLTRIPYVNWSSVSQCKTASRVHCQRDEIARYGTHADNEIGTKGASRLAFDRRDVHSHVSLLLDISHGNAVTGKRLLKTEAAAEIEGDKIIPFLIEKRRRSFVAQRPISNNAVLGEIRTIKRGALKLKLLAIRLRVFFSHRISLSAASEHPTSPVLL